MKDLKVIIPYQRDSLDRRNNVNFLIQYLKSIGIHDILVSCTMKESTDIKDADIIISDTSEFNYKTLLINNAILSCENDYICVCDTDVLIPKTSFLESFEALKLGYEYIYPNQVKMFNIPKQILRYKIENIDFNENYDILWNNSVGGIYFVNKQSFMKIGGENETMLGWGYEDFERNERARRFLLKIYRANFNIWHIEHERKTENSHEGSFAEINKKIYRNVCTMKLHDIEQLVNSWATRWLQME